MPPSMGVIRRRKDRLMTKTIKAMVLFAALFGVTCSEPTTNPTDLNSDSAAAPPSSLGATTPSAAKGGGLAPYDLSFTGNIAAEMPVQLNPNTPFKGFKLNNAVLILPAGETGAGCPPSSAGWGGNTGTWTGTLTIKQGTSSSTLQYFSTSPTYPSNELKLQITTNQKETTETGVIKLAFPCVRALVGLPTSPDPAADPWVTF